MMNRSEKRLYSATGVLFGIVFAGLGGVGGMLVTDTAAADAPESPTHVMRCQYAIATADDALTALSDTLEHLSTGTGKPVGEEFADEYAALGDEAVSILEEYRQSKRGC